MTNNNFEIILYCSDQRRSSDFYSKLLGNKPVLDVPGMTEFQLADNLKLGLMPETGIAKILDNNTPHPSTGNGIPRCEIYIVNDDLETSISRAMDAGAKLISDAKDREWGDKVAYFADPDGHIIALAKKITK